MGEESSEVDISLIKCVHIHYQSGVIETYDEILNLKNMFTHHSMIAVDFNNDWPSIAIIGDLIAIDRVEDRHIGGVADMVQFITKYRSITALRLWKFPDNTECLRVFTGMITKLEIGNYDNIEKFTSFLKDNPQIQNLKIMLSFDLKPGEFASILAAVPQLSEIDCVLHKNMDIELLENIPPQLTSIKVRAANFMRFMRGIVECLETGVLDGSQITSINTTPIGFIEEKYDPIEYAAIVKTITRECPNLETFLCQSTGEDLTPDIFQTCKFQFLEIVINARNQLHALNSIIRDMTCSLHSFHLIINDKSQDSDISDCPEFCEFVEILRSTELRELRILDSNCSNSVRKIISQVPITIESLSFETILRKGDDPNFDIDMRNVKNINMNISQSLKYEGEDSEIADAMTNVITRALEMKYCPSMTIHLDIDSNIAYKIQKQFKEKIQRKGASLHISGEVDTSDFYSPGSPIHWSEDEEYY